MTSDLDEFIKVLRLAYSGELAAAYAYRGHWRSVEDQATRSQIYNIEQDEWHHRNLVGAMLNRVGANPGRLLEFRASILGRALGLLCHASGWLAPMYGAGKLESRNIGEYERAARLAAAAGHGEFVDCLLTMAEVEWEHEKYFRGCVEIHPRASWIRLWLSPGPKENIRGRFESEEIPAPEWIEGA